MQKIDISKIPPSDDEVFAYGIRVDGYRVSLYLLTAVNHINAYVWMEAEDAGYVAEALRSASIEAVDAQQ